MFDIALQIPNFTYPGVPREELFDRVSAVAQTAESAGFGAVMVMDHFYQLPMLGPPTNEMFESYTLLGAIAARTEHVLLGTLVTGVTYRNPAILAKIVTSLDVISHGRAFLGIGAAWYDEEHEGLGVDFPPLGTADADARGGHRDLSRHVPRRAPDVQGPPLPHRRGHQLPRPAAPRRPADPRRRSGEKVTFRIAAQHADMLNTTAGLDELPRKLAALGEHLERLGRERSTIHVSPLASLVLGESMADAERKRDAFLAARGIDWSTAERRRAGDGRRPAGRRRRGRRGGAVRSSRRSASTASSSTCRPTAADLDAVRYAGEVLRSACPCTAWAGQLHEQVGRLGRRIVQLVLLASWATLARDRPVGQHVVHGVAQPAGRRSTA